ncbi:acyl-CoA thioesterase [Rhodococcus sp. NPDC059234]|uniref:acyl-CoA thioesterase n=1 Tax=Rhodococcus sp. NPDC059234 TaxID=3346781 RepID=UPI0036716B39
MESVTRPSAVSTSEPWFVSKSRAISVLFALLPPGARLKFPRQRHAFTTRLGRGDDDVERTHCGKVVAESHVVYERELRRGDEMGVHSWLVGADEKRLDFSHELWVSRQGTEPRRESSWTCTSTSVRGG